MKDMRKLKQTKERNEGKEKVRIWKEERNKDKIQPFASSSHVPVISPEIYGSHLTAGHLSSFSTTFSHVVFYTI
jgi:hypothetical protein